MTVDVRVGERALRELYLAPFEAIVREERPWAVMAAYNGVNGTTMTTSPLLRDILHARVGLRRPGRVGLDGRACHRGHRPGRPRPGHAGAREQVRPVGRGPAGRRSRDGAVDEALIEDKVVRILRLAGRVGALDGGPAAPRLPRRPPDSVPVGRELRAAAAAGFVLARNDGILPLPRSRPGSRASQTARSQRRPEQQTPESDSRLRVAVIGPNAEDGADHGRRQRHRLPAVHGLAAGRACARPGCT